MFRSSKNLQLFATSIVIALAFVSCTGDKPDQYVNPLSKINNKSISGKVFALTDSVDAATCGQKDMGTDFWSDFVFFNDSQFIELRHNCCQGGLDSPDGEFLPGTFKLDSSGLVLDYDEFYGVSYVEPDPADTTNSTWIDKWKLLKNEYGNIKMTVNICGSMPYFKHNNSQYGSSFFAFDGAADGFVKDLKKSGTWDSLYTKSK